MPIDRDVENPVHYTSSNAVCPECSHPIECIEVTRHLGFNIGNIIKYLWRWNLKDGLKDLKKARWYLDDLIRQEEKKQ